MPPAPLDPPPTPSALAAPDWEALLAGDARRIWHPFTQMREHDVAPPVPVAFAEGSELILGSGARVLDGVSSWWTCVHGHGHPHLAAAIARQAQQLDHVMFAGFTHQPAIDLTRLLSSRVHPKLSRFFFSDDGSTAIEVALKMTFQAMVQQGQVQRTRVGALHGAYHGDTLGAVGVGELDNFVSAIFSPLLLRCERLTVPFDPRFGYEAPYPEFGATLAEARVTLARYFERFGAELFAFIAEPLVQGAGGMRPWPVELLVDLRAACDAHGVYLILDEVMTGFGRTGTFFAYESAGVVPDLLCLSKGLTGGTLPLALTCTREDLYAQFLGEIGSGRAFLHGHSYTGNPIACAAAVASLELFAESSTLADSRALCTYLREAWSRVAAHPSTREARVMGTIAACRWVDPASGGPRAQLARDGLTLHRRALALGLLVRPIGDCLYLMPPYCTRRAQVDHAVEVLVQCLDELG